MEQSSGQLVFAELNFTGHAKETVSISNIYQEFPRSMCKESDQGELEVNFD